MLQLSTKPLKSDSGNEGMNWIEMYGQTMGQVGLPKDVTRQLFKVSPLASS